MIISLRVARVKRFCCRHLSSSPPHLFASSPLLLLTSSPPILLSSSPPHLLTSSPPLLFSSSPPHLPSSLLSKPPSSTLLIPQRCFHNCSGLGTCERSFCHCVAGAYGIDCSYSARQPSSSSNQPSGSSNRQGGSSNQQRLEATPRLRIYIYHLPPRFTSWLAARCPNSDGAYLYSTDTRLHRWLLASAYRTHDPHTADYFFVPLHLSLGLSEYEFGLYALTPRGAAYVQDAIEYIRTAHPFFNRSLVMKLSLTRTPEPSPRHVLPYS